MIQCGAILGSVIARAGNRPLLRPYRSDIEARDFVVAGAASGVAAAFSAPPPLAACSSLWRRALPS